MNNEIIKKIFGGQEKLAKLLDVKQQSISDWVRGRRMPSSKNAILIERLSNGSITRAEIRPDIFGDVL